ncbi:MAG: DUF433 domain-containing protein [Chloroflexi bacterium]|jgi:uncharacterized protein (DUF433 family)|nr:DUF433 domain-containing protein [Chloroflexota bacterium]
MNGRITINPSVCHGKPCIAGTRIMVTNILSQLAGGYSIEQILQGYPELTREDVLAAIDYAVAVISDEELIALPRMAYNYVPA